MRNKKIAQDGLTYETRFQNITLEEAEKHVIKKFGQVETRFGVGMFWTKKTKNVNFFKDGKLVAIYNITIRDFWVV